MERAFFIPLWSMRVRQSMLQYVTVCNEAERGCGFDRPGRWGVDYPVYSLLMNQVGPGSLAAKMPTAAALRESTAHAVRAL